MAQRPGAAVAHDAVLGRQRHRRACRRAAGAAGAVHPAALDRRAADRHPAGLAASARGSAAAMGAPVDDPAARGAGRLRLQHPGLSGPAQHHGRQRAAAAIRDAAGDPAGQPGVVPGASAAHAGCGHRRVHPGRAGHRRARLVGNPAPPAGQPRRRPGAAGHRRLRRLFVRAAPPPGGPPVQLPGRHLRHRRRRAGPARAGRARRRRPPGADPAGLGRHPICRGVRLVSGDALLQPRGGVGRRGAGRAVQPPATRVRHPAGGGRAG